jgi:FtsZ-binding cell division protein ZapB
VEGTILVTVVSACVLVACLLVASFLDDAETRPPSRVFAPYARRLLVSDIAPRAPSLGASSPASESAQVTVDAMERRTRDALATLEELRAELEAARETAATLSQEGRRCRRDVARVSAEASTWRRASEAWYAAYAEVVQEAGCLVNTKRNKR